MGCHGRVPRECPWCTRMSLWGVCVCCNEETLRILSTPLCMDSAQGGQGMWGCVMVLGWVSDVRVLDALESRTCCCWMLHNCSFDCSLQHTARACLSPHHSMSNNKCITPLPRACQHMHHITWYPPTHASHQCPTLTVSTLHPWSNHLPVSSHAPCLPLSHLTCSSRIKHVHSSQSNQQPSWISWTRTTTSDVNERSCSHTTDSIPPSPSTNVTRNLANMDITNNPLPPHSAETDAPDQDPHLATGSNNPREQQVQHPASLSQHARYVLAGTLIESANVPPQRHGMVSECDARGTWRSNWSTPPTMSYAWTGSNQTAAHAKTTLPSMNALGVEPSLMAPKTAPLLSLAQHRNEAVMPYLHHSRQELLVSSGIISCYPNIPHSLIYGFDAGIHTVSQTFIPPNHSSIHSHIEVFNQMVNTESEQRKRYIGPFSWAELKSKIGPFQTSPISIIPKPGQPRKFRIIQNLSHPHNANPVPSVNAPINTSQFPCTWRTFATTCALVASLPPGTEASVRDVAEAYRTISIRQEQWPGLVVRLDGEDHFAVDTCCCFGLASSAGVHGIIENAGADLMRAHGIGPIAK